MKKINYLLPLLLLFSIGIFSACNDTNSAEKKVVKLKDKADESIDNLKENLESERTELKKDMKLAEEKLEDEIERLEADLSEATKEGKEEMKEKIETLKSRRDLLLADIEKMGNEVASNWESFQLQIKNRLEEIDEALSENVEEDM